ncbi:hypothetical protein HUB98_07180 [Paenibacillus barcinonensis]|uniref:Uncharacterized protein n=1 Tax=Paenibacillus barcinonensis TaxID=198119 RepID=A0A2V4V7Q7_PAEBA|nr:hypothetical protein [Paenibacillus barcinonensis]PYE42102.1 hypothetical protein DFQ00_1443 [Paenibacillus barcinonensis]QKS56147.1 hypothetical protein HUB98_07180 [Paenibacillus barcinonensis]
MWNLNQAIKRISAIDWSIIGNKQARSHVHLSKEYLRRASLFLEYYPGPCRYPFIVISNSITKPQVNVDDLQILKEIDNSYVREIAKSYLELNALMDEGNQIAIDNKDLLEPAIKLYERGGHFFIRGGYLNVAGATDLLSLTNRVEREPLDISDETLDALDNGQNS